MVYKTVTLIPGDGVGPELTELTVKCIEATGVKIAWEVVDAGEKALKLEGTPLPKKVLDSIRKNKIALKGPITTPVGTGFRSVNVSLRRELDLYSCLRPCRTYPGVRSRYDKIDLVIVRENTEDLYAGIEFEQGKEATAEIIDQIDKLSGSKIRKDSGVSIKPISIFCTERIVKFAFEYAIKNNRKKVTAVHKANIMKYSDGLFLATARKVAERYPDIKFEDRIVDNMCMQLVQKPELYDVLVLPNLYGDIISDLCAGLIGGLGIAPGANFGDDMVLFEPVHGSAPKYKGLNKSNPTAMILSGVLMLRYLGEEAKADKLENAVSEVIREGKTVTYDLKNSPADPGVAGSKEMAAAIISKIKK
ncbi:MAG: isocitrate/isopropylmalate dehydrogenase family protein [bacterium]|nr:isocitrate/isopropylmalate dehydrogenase family protein [bacterium]